MYLDLKSMMSDDVAITSTGTTYSSIYPVQISGNITTSEDAPSGSGSSIAKGNPLPLLVQVTETFTSGGSGTLTVTLETATDEAFTSPVALSATAALAPASLTAGKLLMPQVVPYGVLNFLRMKYQVTTAAMTAGKVTAGITTAIQTNV